MQLFFKTRSMARDFAKKNPVKYKAVDNGTSSKNRWGVVISRTIQESTKVAA